MIFKQHTLFLTIKLLALILAFASCKKSIEQVSSSILGFSAEVVNSGDYPVTILFKCDQFITGKLQWRFSDGRISNETSPLIEFNYSGPLEVTLVNTYASQIDSTTKTIIIPDRQYSVSMIYLLPKDVPYDRNLLDSLNIVTPVIQSWFANQLEGKSFRTNTPRIDTLQSKFYRTDFLTTSIDLIKKIQDEVYARLHTRISSDKNVMLVFLPVSTPGFNGVGGYLNGKRTGVVCGTAFWGLASNQKYFRNLGLWTMTHELGHALELSHNSTPNSVMLGAVANGYYPPNAEIPIFPEFYFLESEKTFLKKSQFIF